MYANPRLATPALSAAYADLESAASTVSTGRWKSAPELLRRWWQHLTQRQVTGDWVERGPVLDVGCHVGDLLWVLKERGLKVSGIEASAAAVERCRARGLKVTQGIIESVALEDAAYQTITLSHVLEHIADPLAVLAKLRRALAPGGRIIICVPNHRGLVARLFGSYWQGWDPPFHLIHFDSKSLRGMLEATGFRVDRSLTRGGPRDVTQSLEKWLRRDMNMLWMRAALLPGAWALGAVGRGGELCMMAHRPIDES